MKTIQWSLLISVLLLSSGLWAATEGTFRGELVRAPQGKQAEPTIYLKGHDGKVREVLLTNAVAEYDDAVAAADREQPAARALVPGTEVRVTAFLDPQSGEWTASDVQVIPHHAASFEDDYGENGTGPDPVTAPSKTVIDSRTI
jgi:hypothetical protein